MDIIDRYTQTKEPGFYHARENEDIDLSRAPLIESFEDINIFASFPRQVNKSYDSTLISTPEALKRLESNSAASSVIATFRSLQEQSRRLERERANAIMERDNLRDRLQELKRKHNHKINKFRRNFEEEYLDFKLSNEQLQLHNRDLEDELNDKVHKFESLQRSHQEYNTRIRNDELDIGEMNRDIEYYEETIHDLQLNIIEYSNRTEDIANGESRLAVVPAFDIASDRIDRLNDQIDAEEDIYNQMCNKMDSLEKYLQIILKVNEELCDTIISTTGIRLGPHQKSAENLQPHIDRRRSSQQKEIFEQRVSLDEVSQPTSVHRHKGDLPLTTRRRRSIGSGSDVTHKSNTISGSGNGIVKGTVASLCRQSAALADRRRSHSPVLNHVPTSPYHRRKSLSSDSVTGISSSVSASIGQSLTSKLNKKRIFVPSGKYEKSQEFNIIAKTSNAYRRAQSLEASLEASKHRGGGGVSPKAVAGDTVPWDIGQVAETLNIVRQLNVKDTVGT